MIGTYVVSLIFFSLYFILDRMILIQVSFNVYKRNPFLLWHLVFLFVSFCIPGINMLISIGALASLYCIGDNNGYKWIWEDKNASESEVDSFIIKVVEFLNQKVC